LKVLSVIALLACILVATSGFSQAPSDPLTGKWTGTWGPSPSDRNNVTVDFKWDGKNLTGAVNPGANEITLTKTMFDPKTGTIHMEADATRPGGAVVHYVIDGKVDKGTMTGTWNHDNRKGDFKITKS
jgi:hypothetical protein